MLAHPNQNQPIAVWFKSLLDGGLGERFKAY
jgi:hypothetical protein